MRNKALANRSQMNESHVFRLDCAFIVDSNIGFVLTDNSIGSILITIYM